jgi:hypothetical protein
MYKRSLREEKYVENIFERDPNGTALSGMDGGDPIHSLVLQNKPNCQSLLLEVVIHTRGCRLLVRSSSPHSTRLAATYKYLAVPRVLVSS